VFPTKQAKSQRRQWQRNQNFIRWQNAWKKTLGETRLSQGASSPQGNERTVYDYDSGSISGQKSDWIRTFRIFIQFHLVEDRSHPVSMETVLLRISAKKIKFSVIHIEINMKFCETWIFVDCSDLSHTCPGCCRTFLFFSLSMTLSHPTHWNIELHWWLSALLVSARKAGFHRPALSEGPELW